MAFAPGECVERFSSFSGVEELEVEDDVGAREVREVEAVG